MGTKTKRKGGAAKASKKTSKVDRVREIREENAGGGRPAKRQPELKGFERQIDNELDGLGRSYDEQSVIMSVAHKQLTDLKKKIGHRMAELGLKLYRYHDGDDVHEIRFKPEALEIVKVKEKVTEVG